MKTIMAYFDTDKKATLTAEKLRRKGFRGKISILRSNNKGTFNDIENQSERREKNQALNTANYGITSGVGGSISFASTMMPRTEPMLTSDAMFGLSKEVSEKKREAIKNIIKAGNAAILVKGKEADEEFIKDVLIEDEAKFI